MKLLYINACVGKESRTKRLADYLVSKLGCEVKEVELVKSNLQPMNEERLKERFGFIASKDFSSSIFDMAKDFALADIIVIAAPYWDMSFPAILKMYIENINVSKITFNFSPQGKMEKVCRATKLYYITTEGGYGSDECGFGYIEGLCKKLYLIDDVKMVKAQGLDIKGNDIEEILSQAKKEIDTII